MRNMRQALHIFDHHAEEVFQVLQRLATPLHGPCINLLQDLTSSWEPQGIAQVGELLMTRSSASRLMQSRPRLQLCSLLLSLIACLPLKRTGKRGATDWCPTKLHRTLLHATMSQQAWSAATTAAVHNTCSDSSSLMVYHGSALAPCGAKDLGFGLQVAASFFSKGAEPAGCCADWVEPQF